MRTVIIFKFLLASLIIFSCTFTFAEDVSITCPDLSGIYECPPYENQPPYTLTQTCSSNDNWQNMTVVSELKPKSTDENSEKHEEKETYSVEGIRIKTIRLDRIHQCVIYEDKKLNRTFPAILNYNDGQKERGTYTFINKAGNLEGVVNGETVITCIKHP